MTDVREIIRHPAYYHFRFSKFALYNDICLLHVAELTVARYGRLLAVDHLTMIGLPAKYVGGGLTAPNIRNRTGALQVGEAVISSCGEDVTVNIHVMCVTPKCSTRKQTAYRGDSGGPLMFEGHIIGVCSYGRKSRFVPTSVFAPVSPYIDWIYNVMQKYEENSTKVQK